MRITAPAIGATVSGVVTVKVDAPGVARVNFYVDNILKGRDVAAPFTFDWHTTNYPDGNHSVKAVSGNGKYVAGPVSYVVANGVTPIPTPVPSESPDRTTVIGTAGSVVDQDGHRWTIGSDGRIYIDGNVDAVTSSVVELAYVSHTVYQLNGVGNWYWKAHLADPWQGPTTVSPLDPTPTPPPTPPPTPTSRLPKQGLNIGIVTLSGTAAFQDQVLDACKDLANGQPLALRVDFWNDTTDVSHFETIKSKAASRGLQVMGLFNMDYPNRQTISWYASQCAALAAHCDFVNTINEPDMSGWPPATCADFLAAAYVAVKAANPNALVIAPSIWKTSSQSALDGANYMKAVVTAAAGRRIADIIDVHLYGDPLDHGDWNSWDRYFTAKYGQSVKDWLIDAGYPLLMCTEAGDTAAVMGDAYQSNAVAHGMDARTSYGLVSFFDYAVPDNASPGGFGLKRSDWSSRPAYAEFKSRSTS